MKEEEINSTGENGVLCLLTLTLSAGLHDCVFIYVRGLCCAPSSLWSFKAEYGKCSLLDIRNLCIFAVFQPTKVKSLYLHGTFCNR